MNQEISPSSFKTLDLSPSTLEILDELEFTSMTKIQSQAIPLLLADRDVVARSQTGSGKTAAFALPMLEKIELQPRVLQGLILCPTRELCTQVARHIRILGRRHKGLHVMTLTGGEPVGRQADGLYRGAHIAVATPGRMIDHLSRQNIDLRRVQRLVLDEADRMLDMGFEDDVKKIVVELPVQRQTSLFSATYPKKLSALVKKVLHEPVMIDATEGESSTPEIEQKFFKMAAEEKQGALYSVIRRSSVDSVLVFCNLKATVKELTRSLSSLGFNVAALHGDLLQVDRDKEMAKFRNKTTHVLVATDVAARGLDVEGLELVVNFDLPHEPEIYVHRIGRTARAGKEGTAISFLLPREKTRVTAISQLMEQSFEISELGELDDQQISKSNREAARSSMKTLFISGGRKNKIRPTDILGALTGEAGGLDGKNVGKIEIGDFHTYVAVDERVAQKALGGLRTGKIKGKYFQVELVR